MVHDNTKNRWLYEKLNDRFKIAFDFIDEVMKNGADAGRYELDGNRVYAMVQEYETRENGELFEAHRKYIDIQAIISGEECFAHADLRFCKVHTPYDKERDIEMLTLDGLSGNVNAARGDFLIYYPHDAHMPCLRCGESKSVKKVVVKIAIE